MPEATASDDSSCRRCLKNPPYQAGGDSDDNKLAVVVDSIRKLALTY